MRKHNQSCSMSAYMLFLALTFFLSFPTFSHSAATPNKADMSVDVDTAVGIDIDVNKVGFSSESSPALKAAGTTSPVLQNRDGSDDIAHACRTIGQLLYNDSRHSTSNNNCGGEFQMACLNLGRHLYEQSSQPQNKQHTGAATSSASMLEETIYPPRTAARQKKQLHDKKKSQKNSVIATIRSLFS